MKIRRKVSAIVAMALAVVVSFTAALNSHGKAKTDPLLAMEIKAAEAAAYDSILDQQLFEVEEPAKQIIKVYNADYELVDEVELEGGEVVEDRELQKLIYQADFLSSFGNTSVYKLMD